MKIKLKELRQLPFNLGSKEYYDQIILFHSGKNLGGEFSHIAIMCIAGRKAGDSKGFEVIEEYDVIFYNFDRGNHDIAIQQSMLLPSRASLLHSRDHTRGFQIDRDNYNLLTLRYSLKSKT